MATKKETQQEALFDAVTVVQSDKYRQYRDLLMVLLEEDKMYTEKDVETLIGKALKQPVQKDINE